MTSADHGVSTPSGGATDDAPRAIMLSVELLDSLTGAIVRTPRFKVYIAPWWKAKRGEGLSLGAVDLGEFGYAMCPRGDIACKFTRLSQPMTISTFTVNTSTARISPAGCDRQFGAADSSTSEDVVEEPERLTIGERYLCEVRFSLDPGTVVMLSLPPTWVKRFRIAMPWQETGPAIVVVPPSQRLKVVLVAKGQRFVTRGSRVQLCVRCLQDRDRDDKAVIHLMKKVKDLTRAPKNTSPMHRLGVDTRIDVATTSDRCREVLPHIGGEFFYDGCVAVHCAPDGCAKVRSLNAERAREVADALRKPVESDDVAEPDVDGREHTLAGGRGHVNMRMEKNHIMIPACCEMCSTVLMLPDYRDSSAGEMLFVGCRR